jgi:hypothetical protein
VKEVRSGSRSGVRPRRRRTRSHAEDQGVLRCRVARRGTASSAGCWPSASTVTAVVAPSVRILSRRAQRPCRDFSRGARLARRQTTGWLVESTEPSSTTMTAAPLGGGPNFRTKRRRRSPHGATHRAPALSTTRFAVTAFGQPVPRGRGHLGNGSRRPAAVSASVSMTRRRRRSLVHDANDARPLVTYRADGSLRGAAGGRAAAWSPRAASTGLCRRGSGDDSQFAGALRVGGRDRCRAGGRKLLGFGGASDASGGTPAAGFGAGGSPGGAAARAPRLRPARLPLPVLPEERSAWLPHLGAGAAAAMGCAPAAAARRRFRVGAWGSTRPEAPSGPSARAEQKLSSLGVRALETRCRRVESHAPRGAPRREGFMIPVASSSSAFSSREEGASAADDSSASNSRARSGAITSVASSSKSIGRFERAAPAFEAAPGWCRLGPRSSPLASSPSQWLDDGIGFVLPLPAPDGGACPSTLARLAALGSGSSRRQPAWPLFVPVGGVRRWDDRCSLPLGLSARSHHGGPHEAACLQREAAPECLKGDCHPPFPPSRSAPRSIPRRMHSPAGSAVVILRPAEREFSSARFAATMTCRRAGAAGLWVSGRAIGHGRGRSIRRRARARGPSTKISLPHSDFVWMRAPTFRRAPRAGPHFHGANCITSSFGIPRILVRSRPALGAFFPWAGLLGGRLGREVAYFGLDRRPGPRIARSSARRPIEAACRRAVSGAALGSSPPRPVSLRACWRSMKW